MKLTGSADAPAPPAEVFDRLLDPRVLELCIPGCESMEESAPGVYETLVRAGVGPIKGSFTGKVSVSDVVRGESYRMAVSGKASVGYIEGGAAISLEAVESGTRVHYDGDARISGALAAIGSRLIEAAARNVARKFFDELAQRVAAPRQPG